MKISTLPLFCILTMLSLKTNCVRQATDEQSDMLMLSHQNERVHELLQESKELRPETPRVKHVEEKNRAKYLHHREFEHKFEKSGEMANYILHERPIRHFDEKEKMQQQKLERHQAREMIPLDILIGGGISYSRNYPDWSWDIKKLRVV